jgi:hypothetical protein
MILAKRLGRLRPREEIMRRRSFVYPALSVAAAWLMAGCSDTSPERAVQVRDSSGVTIVTNSAVKDLPEAFRISPIPMLDLGGNRGQPDQELDPQGPFHNAARMSDGRFVAVSNHDLKMYGQEGEFIRTIGRQGEGPGEFGQVRSVCIATGDTVVAVHYSRPSISVFTPDGEHVRTLNVNEGYVNGSGCFADGSVLVVADLRARHDSDLPPDEARTLDRVMTVRRIAIDGTDLGTLGDFPAGTVDLAFQTIANVIPHAGDVYVGDGRLPEFHVHSSAGTLKRITRWTEPLVPVTTEMIDERIRGSIPLNTPQSEVQRRLEIGRSRPHPSHVPVYFNLDNSS